MILHWHILDDEIPANVLERINSDITIAFDLDGTGTFIVNPTKYYKIQDGKLMPAVINSANYISKSFQHRLKDLNWKIDHTIAGQEIDGYIAIEYVNHQASYLNKENLISLVNDIDPDSDNYLFDISSLYSKYYRKRMFVPSKNIEKYTRTIENITIKIGLEFETGNIASSFRAISKLNNLFDIGEIDIGVFITSEDKTSSTKIWPSSNRNGSIEELNKRKFIQSIKFPAIIVGFAPDGWDENVGFLKSDKNRFSLSENIEIREVEGKSYIHYINEGYHKPYEHPEQESLFPEGNETSAP
jgi:hypothetical protein